MARIRGVLTEPGSTFAASMLRDVEAGNRIEADHVIGDLLARAGALGVATPRLETAYCHLKAYENRRAREAA
jgi:2-dehydropantoate 2-reductase